MPGDYTRSGPDNQACADPPDHTDPPARADPPARTDPSDHTDPTDRVASPDAAAPALLPTLDPGITLLAVEGKRGDRVLQSLVLDHLLLARGPAFWVDARGHARTTSLARLAPSGRLLDRIRVARGFTPYQHFAIASGLADAVDRHRSPGEGVGACTGDRAPPLSLVVAPAVDAPYRDADALADAHAETLQARVLARLAGCARRDEVPVLVTRTAEDGFAAPVEAAADHTLRCVRTDLGPRFVGDDVETLVYPLEGGRYYQTTLAYWRRVLRARATRAGVARAGSQSPDDGSSGPGASTGTTRLVDGTTASMTAGPLLDAWAAAGGR